MRCLHPKTRVYIDPVSLERKVVDYPCGHCIACLHNEQDSWAIRMNETARAYGSFVYDTLTFSPSALPLAVVSPESFSDVKDSPEVIKLLCRYVDRDTGEFCVPYVVRSLVRDWIRRGRELFYYFHRYRPDWKYIIFEEYGPKTSRPHFHLMFFGISHADYVKYLAKPWRRDIGFTKTKFIRGDTRKDRQCISRYVSKYVSKGSFESPLVKAGLCPKPFRSISHGIGEEYLSNSMFDFFRGYIANLWRRFSIDTSYPVGFVARNAGLAHHLPDLPKVSERLLRDLSCYYDERGYPHALPRYYKMKLLNLFKPNLLSYAFQTLLLARAQLQHNQALAEFARSLGYFRAKGDALSLGLSSRLYNLLDLWYFSFRQVEARVDASRRYIRLKNHYFRPLQSKAYAWAC